LVGIDVKVLAGQTLAGTINDGYGIAKDQARKDVDTSLNSLD
jgi:hypothetical protein